MTIFVPQTENYACVAENKLCDGNNDCGDFSDEQGCNINECEMFKVPKISVCAHICEDRKVGYECKCNNGFQVSPNNRHHCIDINECLQRPCSQYCNNTIGSYHCSCNLWYTLENKHSCKAISSEPVTLIFSNRYYIREVTLNGEETLLTHNLSNAVALDYDMDSRCYFWSDVTTHISKIIRYCPHHIDNKTSEIHSTNLKNPDGLAVDWIVKNLYWCDKGLDTIEVSKLDGKYRKTLIRNGLQEPRAIAIDPFGKHLFWTDWGENPHIGKAGMDGSNPHVIYKDNLGWPNALTINFETKELYFGDAREDYIGACDYNGENRRIIVSRHNQPTLKLHHIFSIAIWEDRIYWTDWETKTIEYCHKDTGANCSTLLATIHRPMDLRVYHSYRQPDIIFNPCDTAECSTLCLLSPVEPNGYKCACPDNYKLAQDNKTCIENCTSAQFACKTTYKCIPFYWRCDTNDDCGDGSDEPISCRPFNCAQGQYQCFNTKCINPTLICDGIDQCGDQSDEIDCDKYTCFDSQFKCSASHTKNAHCIDEIKKCDGKMDCPNGDDEQNCANKTCSSTQFQCADGKCIVKVWLCDGDNDCEDDSDEKNCEHRQCPSKEFR